MALTDVGIRKAKAGPKAYKMSDLSGLFLLVEPTGGKLWRMKYRVDGREKKLAIGRYPEIGLAEARRRRDAAREQLAQARAKNSERRRVRSSVLRISAVGPEQLNWQTADCRYRAYRHPDSRSPDRE